MTREEYDAVYHRNVGFKGYGLETETIMPCPGCCAPDFVSMPVLKPMVYFEQGAVCAHCGRGFKAIVERRGISVTKFEVVQTEGPDLPDYLAWIRRV